MYEQGVIAVLKSKSLLFFCLGRKVVHFISPVRELSDCHKVLFYHGPTHCGLISPAYLFPPHSIHLVFPPHSLI